MAEPLVCDRIRERDETYWRVKTASAIVSRLTGWVLDESAAESMKFDRARRENKTCLAGLLDGHKFERIAGREGCSGERKEGPPKNISAKTLRIVERY